MRGFEGYHMRTTGDQCSHITAQQKARVWTRGTCCDSPTHIYYTNNTRKLLSSEPILLHAQQTFWAPERNVHQTYGHRFARSSTQSATEPETKLLHKRDTTKTEPIHHQISKTRQTHHQNITSTPRKHEQDTSAWPQPIYHQHMVRDTT